MPAISAEWHDAPTALVKLVERSIGGGDELAENMRRDRNLAVPAFGFDEHESAPDLNIRRRLSEPTALHTQLPPLESSERLGRGRETAVDCKALTQVNSKGLAATIIVPTFHGLPALRAAHRLPAGSRATRNG